MRCPICGGESGILGVLGNLKHYLCRYCGMQFSRKIKRRKREHPKVAVGQVLDDAGPPDGDKEHL